MYEIFFVRRLRVFLLLFLDCLRRRWLPKDSLSLLLYKRHVLFETMSGSEWRTEFKQSQRNKEVREIAKVLASLEPVSCAYTPSLFRDAYTRRP